MYRDGQRRIQNVLVVEEGSARVENFYTVRDVDQFSICKPRSKQSASFHQLKLFLSDIATDMEEKPYPESLQHLPKFIVGIDFQVQAVLGKLVSKTPVALVGIGGLGKTTLAKAVFNTLIRQFEFSCFVSDVKNIKGEEHELRKEAWTRMYCHGKMVASALGWHNLRGKKLLLVLDDVSENRDVRVLSEIAKLVGSDSRFILTSRDKGLIGRHGDVYEVPFLNEVSSIRLFTSCAFPTPENLPPPEWASIKESIVKKCSGLPLTLEVIGSYLRGNRLYDQWERTLDALKKAEEVSDLDDNLWAKLRISYEDLKPKEKHIFLDATTFFSSNRNWTLCEAKAAWSTAYDAPSAGLLWETLVNRSLVYQVKEDEIIKVHDQLESLGRKIASESDYNNHCRVWEGEKGAEMLQTTNLSDSKAIDALRMEFSPRRYGDVNLPISACRKLKKAHFLELHNRVVIDGATPEIMDRAKEDGFFPTELVLLKCIGQTFLDTGLQTSLTVLKISYLEYLSDSIGKLSSLAYLDIMWSEKLSILPDSFGKLRSLKDLKIAHCGSLRTLPKSFGQLKELERLSLSQVSIQSLPDSFGQLPSLNHLKIWSCPLQSLPLSFGELPSLIHLEFFQCQSLKTLPETFGRLQKLKSLKFEQSGVTSRESLGELRALEHLDFDISGPGDIPDSFSRNSQEIQDDSQGTEDKPFDQSDDNSGLEQQDVADEVAIDGSSHVTSMEELRKAIKLSNLSQVKSIVLAGHDIGTGHLTLAKALASGQLSALEDLWLRSTGIDDDASEAIGIALTSGQIQSLIRIDFSGNKIGTKGIEAFGRAIRSGKLEKLKELRFHDAGINDDDMATLAMSFQFGKASVLPNLSHLNLSENRFTQVGLQSLAYALISGCLNSLERLNLLGSSYSSQEGANALVSALTVNDGLAVQVEFDWYLFPGLERQLEQLRHRNIRHKEIKAGLSGSSMVPAAFGKVYLCGNPEAGKTTLRHSLQRSMPWERSPHVETRTRGTDISEVCCTGSKREKEKQITLLVSDIAGLQDWHLVHNAFFPAFTFSEVKATIFVIVCNNKNSDDVDHQLEYWLRYIASSCQETITQHVFVVLNNIGGDKKVQRNSQGWEMLLKHKRLKFRGFLDVHTDPFVLDVRRRAKVNGFKRRLLEHFRKLLNEQNVPEICDAIQRSLPIWSEAREKFPVLAWEEFLHEVQQLSGKLSEQMILSATKYLNEAGVLIYIDKSFPPQWDMLYRRLIILNPNWFCNEIVGNLFLSEDMLSHRERGHLFRKKVDATTGSISMSDLKRFFKSSWSPKVSEDLIAILLWLGLGYKGKEENVFIPSLIYRNVEPGNPWLSQSAHDDGEEQWVMGFSIEHQKDGTTLAPMSLWHRFQVLLAQTPKFNNDLLPDNEFVAGKDFVKFTVDYMNVMIEVNIEKDSYTFDKISIFVKPAFRRESLNIIQRKQRQVNLADDVANLLLGLWNEVANRVQYVHRVVWPWPVSQSRSLYDKDRNVEVAHVKRLVQMHGMGRKMQWLVGRDSAITEDQLLSTKDKKYVILLQKRTINDLRHGMQEAVNLRIYPCELTEESEVSLDGIKTEEAALGLDGIERAIPPTIRTAKNLHRLPTVISQLHELEKKLEKIDKNLENVESLLLEEFADVLNEQKRVFRRLQDTELFFKEDKDRTCPNLLYLGERDSSIWASLKQALSSTVNVSLRFACEAMFNNYRPHVVKDQQGIDVSTSKPAFKRIVPWLKVSLTVFLISAKIATNVVAPGAGLLLTDLQHVQQAKSLLDGIVLATDFSMPELDKMMIEGMGLDPSDPLWDPREVYGKSRAAITNLIGHLTPEAYKEKFGLRKVSLAYDDGSLHGVVWICTDCHQQFRKSELVRDM